MSSFELVKNILKFSKRNSLPGRSKVWIDMLHGLVVGRWGAFPTSGKCGAQKREESGGWSEGRNVRIIAQCLDGTHIQATFDHG